MSNELPLFNFDVYTNSRIVKVHKPKGQFGYEKSFEWMIKKLFSRSLFTLLLYGAKCRWVDNGGKFSAF